jgi:hypothetical protein
MPRGSTCTSPWRNTPKLCCQSPAAWRHGCSWHHTEQLRIVPAHALAQAPGRPSPPTHSTAPPDQRLLPAPTKQAGAHTHTHTLKTHVCCQDQQLLRTALNCQPSLTQGLCAPAGPPAVPCTPQTSPPQNSEPYIQPLHPPLDRKAASQPAGGSQAPAHMPPMQEAVPVAQPPQHAAAHAQTTSASTGPNLARISSTRLRSAHSTRLGSTQSIGSSPSPSPSFSASCQLSSEPGAGQ